VRKKIYFVICSHCNHVKSWGDEDRITVDKQPYLSSNPLSVCGKCGRLLEQVWDHQEGFESAKMAYERQNVKRTKVKERTDADDTEFEL
jgi:hypothetical protein